jgi:hypothetical protein
MSQSDDGSLKTAAGARRCVLLTSIARRAFRSVIWFEAPASIFMSGSVPLERPSHIWFLLLALFTLVGICGAQSLQQKILTSIYVK